MREIQNLFAEAPRISRSNLGKDFEKILERSHAIYAVKHLAIVDKNPIEWRFTSRGQYEVLKHQRADLVAVTNTGRFIKRMKSDVDFSGTAKAADGRGIAIHFDAKQITRKSFPLANVQEHQVQTLLAKERVGAISGLMIHFTDFGRTFFLSATEVDNALIQMLCKQGSKSIPFIDCETKGVEIPDTAITACDWYSVLIK